MVLVNILVTDSISYVSHTRHLVSIAVLLGIDKYIQVDIKHVLSGPYFKTVTRTVSAVMAWRREGQRNFILIIVVLHIRAQTNEQ